MRKHLLRIFALTIAHSLILESNFGMQLSSPILGRQLIRRGSDLFIGEALSTVALSPLQRMFRFKLSFSQYLLETESTRETVGCIKIEPLSKHLSNLKLKFERNRTEIDAALSRASIPNKEDHAMDIDWLAERVDQILRPYILNLDTVKRIRKSILPWVEQLAFYDIAKFLLNHSTTNDYSSLTIPLLAGIWFGYWHRSRSPLFRLAMVVIGLACIRIEMSMGNSILTYGILAAGQTAFNWIDHLLLSRPADWLPSRAELLSLATREKVPVRVVHAKFDSISLPFLRRDMPAGPMFLKRLALWGHNSGQFEPFEEDSSRYALRLKGFGFPADTRGWIGLRPNFEFGMQRTLMEEVFHVLENEPHSLNEATTADVHARELINDFLQLLFYPIQEVMRFGGHYTNWSWAQRRNLLYRYRDDPHLDPNYDIPTILNNLLKDIRENETLGFGISRISLFNLVRGNLAYGRSLSMEDLIGYLEALISSERFHLYQPLFPSWINPGKKNSRREAA